MPSEFEWSIRPASGHKCRIEVEKEVERERS